MKIEYFSLKNKYEIKYKLFLPEDAVKNVIIGVHGFAGDKESSMLEKLANALSEKNTALL
jgi:predicted alpha/beta-fold hydrolase